MTSIPEYIMGLLSNPVETLKTELKDWIDPDEADGKAKIVKASIAFRNQNGGVLLIGIKNDGIRNPKCPFTDVTRTFDQEKIQSTVAHYSATPFEVKVWFVPLDGIRYVAIEVPGGFRFPVASKRDLYGAKREKKLVGENTIYVRTLTTNNFVSTAALNHTGLQDLFERCFENREADIGRLLRRHLTDRNVEVIRQAFSSETSVASPERSKTDLFTRMNTWADRYAVLVTERDDIPDHGSFEVGVVVRGASRKFLSTKSFLRSILSRNPQLTGWPVWLDSRNFADQASQPTVHEDGWEALIASVTGHRFDQHLDYWYLSGKGEFYLRRAFQDDIGGSERVPPPRTALDIGLVILRVAEAIVVALEYSATFEPEEDGELVFAFRWTGLNGRQLSTWADPHRFGSAYGISSVDQVENTISMAQSTSKEFVAEYVKLAVAPLFSKFNGWECPDHWIEDLFSRLIDRRL